MFTRAQHEKRKKERKKVQITKEKQKKRWKSWIIEIYNK